MIVYDPMSLLPKAKIRFIARKVSCRHDVLTGLIAPVAGLFLKGTETDAVIGSWLLGSFLWDCQVLGHKILFTQMPPFPILYSFYAGVYRYHRSGLCVNIRRV